MIIERIIARRADARIGDTYNQYSRSRLRRERLAAYLEARWDAPIMLVGEAAGYRRARVSGIPFTSERQLTGTGPAEATATIVHRLLAELGLEERVLLWNVVPTHPGTECSNRRPTRLEIEAGLEFLEPLLDGRLAIAVGRVAESVLGGPYVRHPARGGAEAFRRDIADVVRRCVSGSNLTFSGSGGGKPTITWTASTHTLTILLGSKSGSGTQPVTVASSIATYKPSSAIQDSAGNGSIPNFRAGPEIDRAEIECAGCGRDRDGVVAPVAPASLLSVTVTSLSV